MTCRSDRAAAVVLHVATLSCSRRAQRRAAHVRLSLTDDVLLRWSDIPARSGNGANGSAAPVPGHIGVRPQTTWRVGSGRIAQASTLRCPDALPTLTP